MAEMAPVIDDINKEQIKCHIKRLQDSTTKKALAFKVFLVFC